MTILPLRPELEEYLRKHRLVKKWNKQKQLFEQNWRYPSLHTEILEPKELRIYSFRIDDQYRAIFVFTESKMVEVIDINNHYE